MKKIIAIAASFIIIAVSAFSLFMISLFENNTQVVKLDIDNKIKFYQTVDIDLLGEKPDWYLYDDLTDEEINALFGDLPITARGVFNTKENNDLVGVEGLINDILFSISLHIEPIDMYAIGKERISDFKGIPVIAGYTFFNTCEDTNVTSYYAMFKMGDKTFYLNTYVYSDYKVPHTSARNEIANAIGLLIDNGEIDFSEIKR